MKRIFEGLRYGSAVGAFFSTLMIVAAFLNGSATIAVRGQLMNAWVAAAGYIVGGAAGGAVVGLLYPLTRSRIGAALVGTLALMPIMIGVAGSAGGFSEWTGAHTFTVVATSVLLGGIVGAIVLVWLHEQ